MSIPIKSLLNFVGVDIKEDFIAKQLKEGITYVNELNKSLTKLSTVYMKGQSEIQQYASKFSNLGMVMGITTSEIAKGAVELANQGFNEEQMFSRLESAAKFAAINNLEFSTSAQTLNDTVSSMNVDLDRAADVFSYLGDATAAGADDIGKAMQSVGGTARAVGIEFEKVSSWVATLSSNTQESADAVGNSIKNILERMQSFKETGLNSTDGTTINDVAKALAEIGVAFENEGGNVRNFGTILDEIGLRWDSISSKQQAYIATTLAGSNQSAQFASLMQNYGQSVDLYKGSLDSAGISTEKFGLYQQGTEAHINTMKAALEGLWSSMFKSEDIRNVIDLMTGLVNTLNQVANTFGGLQTSVGVATTAFLFFKRATLATKVDKLFESLATAGLEMRSLTIFSELYTRSATSAKLATLGLQTVLSVGFVAVITLATVAISKLIAAHQQAKEEQKAFAEQQQHIANSWSTQSAKINALVGEYERLNQLTQNGMVFADVEQENNYRQIVEELATLMPNLVESIDDKGNKHLKNADAIKEELIYAEELAKLNQNQKVLDAESTFKEKIDEVEKYEKQISDLQGKMALGGNVMGTTFNLFNESQLNQMETKMLTLQQKVATASNALRADLGSIVQNMLSLNKVKMDDGLTKQIDKITSNLSLEGLSPKEINDKATVIASLATKLNGLQISTDESVIERTKDEIKVLGTELGLTDNRINLFIASILDAKEALKQQASVLEPIVDRSKDVEQAMADLSNGFTQAVDNVSPLNAAIQKLKQGKSLTADEIANLMQKVDGFSEAVSNENGVLKVNEAAVIKLRDGHIQSFKDILKAKESQVAGLEKETIKDLKNYGIQIEGIKNVAQAMEALASKREEVDRDIRTVMRDPEATDETRSYLAEKQHDKAGIIAAQNTLQMIEKAKAQNDKLKNLYYAMLTSAGKTTDANDKLKSSNDKLKDSNDKLNDSYTETVEVLTQVQEKLKELQKQQDIEESRRKRMQKSSKEYQDSIRESIRLKQEELKLVENADPSELVAKKVTRTVNNSDTTSNSSASTGNQAGTSTSNASLNKMFSAFSGLEGKFKYSQDKSGGTYGEFVKDAISDCSLFVQQMFKQFMGIDLGRDTSAQFKKGKTINKIEDLQPGDLVFFDTNPNKANGHVGIYKGNGKFEHVGQKTGLSEQDINNPYWSKSFTSGKRVLSDDVQSTSTPTSSSNSNGKTTDNNGKIEALTPEEYKKSAEQKEKDIERLKNEGFDSVEDLLRSIQYNADIAVEELERLITASKKRQEKLDPTSEEFKKENKYQVNIQSGIQKIKNQEALDLDKEIKRYGVKSDDWQKLIKQLQTERSDIQSEKYKTLVDNLNIDIDATKEHIDEMDKLIQQSQKKMAQYAEGTPEYNKELNYQIELKKKQKKENDDLIVSIENLMKSENLDAATKKNLKAILDDLNLKDYTGDVKNLNAELIKSKAKPLEDRLDNLNYQYDISSTKLNAMREGTAEYNAEMKNQIAIIKQSKEEIKKLFEYYSSQANNQELLPTDREEYRKKAEDMVKQGIDQEDKLKSIREKYADNVIEKYKRVLQEQQKLRNAAFDKEKEAEDARHKTRIENLDKEMSRFEEVINAQIKLMDTQDTTDDFNEELNKKIASRAKLQTRLDELSKDDSIEGRANTKELQEQIATQTEEIERFKLERERTLRKDNLQKQLEDKRKTVDTEKEIENDKNTNIIKNLEYLKKQNDEYYDGLLNDEENFFKMKQNLMSEDTILIQGELDKIKLAYDQFFKELEQNSAGYAEKMKANLKYSIDLDSKYSESFPIDNKPSSSGETGNVVVQPETNTPLESMRNRNAAWAEYLENKVKAEKLLGEMKGLGKNSSEYSAKQKELQELNDKNQEYRDRYGFQDGTSDQLKKKVFSAETGGMTPASMPTEGKFLLAHEKELVLNESDTSRLLDTVNVVRDIFAGSKVNLSNLLSSIIRPFSPAPSAVVSSGGINVNVTIEKMVGDETGAKKFFDIVQQNLKRGIK
ncbi:phage tail tape measure protein [Paenibacillus sp. GCM10012306]|uniref:phage tail tape measure protein n=1 Tax=Paenibacillus sp. GCM10012306 TaxID=3317342 RepID=UPI0036161DF1